MGNEFEQKKISDYVIVLRYDNRPDITTRWCALIYLHEHNTSRVTCMGAGVEKTKLAAFREARQDINMELFRQL